MPSDLIGGWTPVRVKKTRQKQRIQGRGRQNPLKMTVIFVPAMLQTG